MLFGLSSCQGDETISGYSATGVTWVLESLNGVAFTASANLTFPGEGEIAGKAPCNAYFGAQTAPYPWFALEDFGSTKMACADMDQESAYFTALAAMTIAEVAGSTLILTNDDGGEMVFKGD
ncbi:META domain-containing protein [Falsihalocynthiibacter sp. S25ZX9]|uniref:META domain-containing protein n=1 Tax=Falsihalocynthiibacter sp. S25ZX9 TaxID=3240870 RepID=UPI00350EE0B3